MEITMGEDDEMFFDYAFGGEKVEQELTGTEESIRLYTA